MRIRWIATTLTAMLVSTPGIVMGGGFNVYEMGTRATALGGAFTATSDDPSAIFYNPAGLAWQRRGFTASLNVSPLIPEFRASRATGITADLFPGDATGQTKDAIFTPSGGYLHYGHDDRLSLGLGFFTPFGLGIEWDDPDNFSGRTLSTNAQLRGFYLSPVVAVRASDKLAVAAGFHLVWSDLKLERVQTQRFGTDAATYNVIDVSLEGTSGLRVGPAVALMAKPSDRLTLGINFKAGVTNEFRDEGASLTQKTTGIAALDAAVAGQIAALGGTSQTVSGDLSYPGILVVGGRYQITNSVGFMADFVWFDWSVFDEVKLEFSNPALNTTMEELYTDGQQLRFGLEVAATEDLRLMGGFAYDNSPQPEGRMSPILPDADRKDYSLGLTYDQGTVQFSAAYMLVSASDRSTIVDGVGRQFEGFDAVYDNQAHIFSVAATYGF